MKYILLLSILAAPVSADPLRVHETARVLFDRLPRVQSVDDLTDVCGGGRNSNPNIGYCTTLNVIHIRRDFATRPQSAYEMAHVLGHAIQVRHGVADIALREIRSRRSEEAALRGMVTRQVECVAGVLMARAGQPKADLGTLFEDEPFQDAHWGRRPLDSGPRVSIGMAARMDWFAAGFDSADFSSCSVGEMSSDLIVEALNP